MRRDRRETKKTQSDCDEGCCTLPEIIYEKSCQCIPQEIQMQLEVPNICECISELKPRPNQGYPSEYDCPPCCCILTQNKSHQMFSCPDCERQMRNSRCECYKQRILPAGHISVQKPVESVENICSCLRTLCEYLRKQPILIFFVFIIFIYLTSR